MTVCYTIFNRDGFNSDDEQNGSKLFGESSPQDKQATQGVPDILVKKNAGWDIYIWFSFLFSFNYILGFTFAWGYNYFSPEITR